MATTTVAARIATLLTEQAGGGALTDPRLAAAASRSWTLTETIDSAGSVTCRVTTAVVAGATATASEVPVVTGPQPDPTLSYEQLVRYRDALLAADFAVQEVFEDWRTVALDVRVAE
ncbi:hypothetical protein UK99_22965, partial [Frankia casuarinae]